MVVPPHCGRPGIVVVRCGPAPTRSRTTSPGDMTHRLSPLPSVARRRGGSAPAPRPSDRRGACGPGEARPGRRCRRHRGTVSRRAFERRRGRGLRPGCVTDSGGQPSAPIRRDRHAPIAEPFRKAAPGTTGTSFRPGTLPGAWETSCGVRSTSGEADPARARPGALPDGAAAFRVAASRVAGVRQPPGRPTAPGSRPIPSRRSARAERASHGIPTRFP